jgi:hypothetical protein
MEVNTPPPDALIARLSRGHPRLLASRQAFDEIRRQATADAQIAAWCEKLREKARRVLSEPPSRYEIPDGKRLLATSRRVLDRVSTLSLLYRLDGDARYKERAWQELQAAASFRDWNPSHFLDTAEMTNAFAIGYDWLYDAWTPEQRRALRTAIVEKGLKPALESYRGGGSYGWWVKARHNWNQVCNGGIGMGALAIGDEAAGEGLSTAEAGEILHGALASLRLPMAEFAPDGAWNEGPGYWNYATAYNVVFLAALESALGTEFGLSQYPGFADTGLFPIYLTGPLGRTFNYADGGEGTIRAPQMFWLARKFDRPEYASYQQRVASPTALDVLWGVQASHLRSETSPAPRPLDKYFRGVEVASFRSAWEDRDALFVALKAGDNKANHSNLDLGTFVLDALGVRWAVDLGADNYNLPGYFGKQRWDYYRMRAEGHNSLVLAPGGTPPFEAKTASNGGAAYPTGAGPDQDPAASARIMRFQSRPEKAFAVVDLTSAYARHARGVQRGLALLDRRQVLVQDEIQAEKPTEVWWFLHTPAQAQVSEGGRTATLTQENVRLQARLLSPPDASFIVKEAGPLPTSPRPDGQAKNDSVRKLAVHLTGVTDARLVVLLTPLRAGETAPAHVPTVAPLAEW